MCKGNNTIRKNVLEAFSTEDKCLAVLFEETKTELCPKCKQPFRYHRVRNRKCYECSNCANQIYPMKGTIFEGSRTPLPVWFAMMVDFLCDHRGVSAYSLAQKYGLTYKTAFRMEHKIRGGMKNTFTDMLSGTVEIDEHFHGGKRKLKQDEGKMGIGDKQIVFGMLERKNCLRMVHVIKKDAVTMRPLIKQTIEKGSVIHHDNNGTYGDMKEAGFIPKLVKNKAGKEFRRGIHNNNIESQWSRMKRQILATYCSVSPKYLQAYLDEYSFRYNVGKGRLMLSLPETIMKICLNDQHHEV